MNKILIYEVIKSVVTMFIDSTTNQQDTLREQMCFVLMSPSAGFNLLVFRSNCIAHRCNYFSCADLKSHHIFICETGYPRLCKRLTHLSSSMISRNILANHSTLLEVKSDNIYPFNICDYNVIANSNNSQLTNLKSL